ncbi:CHAT domain-containing protein [Thermoleptolyngbya sp. C42_A2020_037]|uniref:CHAT domain-containing tetratricopeptide repeat protein n=1 Tax=Thermoleptolyngbya sp. C42_A2020_037 TaxID=2747799 RepID=UPI0019D82FAC|nr:CHAT domain-containing protein [Thermoleptolyngbya sp. C42_A2020_037]MBF2086055.1 CHAT domain-containing protein [Thermoleptolyngbya sp. C42_A2020_037]
MKQPNRTAALLLTWLLGGQTPGLAFVPAAPGRSPGQITAPRVARSPAAPTLADAERLYEEVNQLYAQGRYEAALDRAKQALRVLEQVLPSTNPNIPHGFNQVAVLLSLLDRHEEAESYHTMARLLIRGGKGTPIAPAALAQLAQTLPQNVVGQLDVRSMQANRHDYLEVFEPVLSSVALSQLPQMPLTGGYFNLHQFDGVAGQTVNLAVTSEDLDDLIIFVFSRQQGFIAAASGRATQISLSLEDAGPYQVTVGSRTAGRTGRYRVWWGNASGTATNALTYRGEHNRVPRGGEYSLDSLYTLAAPNLEGHIARLRAEKGDRHPEVVEPLISLATTYVLVERWADAGSAYAEALEILRAQRDPNPQHLIQAIDGVALMAYQQGDLERAVALHQEALSLERATLGRTALLDGEAGFVAQRAIAARLLFLVQIYQTQQRYDEAEPLLIEMIDLARRFNQPSERAIFLEAASTIYRTQGRNAEADALALEAFEGQPTAPEERSPRDPHQLNGRALTYHSQGRYDEAERLYRQALDAAETLYSGDLQAFRAPIFYNLAGLYQAQGKIPAALEVLQAGIALEQQEFDRRLATLNETARQRYTASVANTLNHAISLHLKTAPNDLAAAQLAATTLLRRKGRVLEAGITTLALLEQNPNPEDERLLAELDRRRQQVAEITFAEQGSFPQAQAQLRTLRSQIDEIEAVLARRSAALAGDAPLVNLADIQARLPADGALVEYVRYRPFDPRNPLGQKPASNLRNWSDRGFGDPRYAAYVLLPSGDVRWADLGDAAAIDGQIQRFLEFLRCGERRATPCYEPEQLKPVAQTLYQLIFAPVQAHLGNASHVLISPDSQLNLVPFAALVDGQNRYLIETYTLTYLTSGRDLLRQQPTAPPQQPPVVLANPDFDTADAQGVIQVASASRGGARSPDMGSLRFRPLAGSALEVAAIRPWLGEKAVMLTEARATENALKQVQGPSILHLATHGFFLPDVPISPPETGVGTLPQSANRVENPLLRSGLALAGFNQRESDGEDGVLTALEVASLSLRGTRLVVLSACETGLGDVADGEGVYGLRRAFVLAGAESLLMSLWQVGDRRTADLMQQYYERLAQGTGRSEALRQIQLAALENPAHRHPYHWAAFFLSGQWTATEPL